jgi:hypothetical protein
MVKLEVENLKRLRESLCVAQSGISQAYAVGESHSLQSEYAMSHIRTIQEVLDQIDILRPLGPDGKHGNRHTEFCGCEDNPYLDLLNEWRRIPEYPWYELSGRGYIRIASDLDDEMYNKIGEIAVQDVGLGDVEYSIMVEQGPYIESFMAPVSYLIKITFPELKKEN